MPARLAFPWLYSQVLTRAGADRDPWTRTQIDALLGDPEAIAEQHRSELELLAAAGGEIG